MSRSLCRATPGRVVLSLGPLFIALLLSKTSATKISQIAGTYTLLPNTSSPLTCPSLITHSDPEQLGDTAVSGLRHARTTTDAGQCTSDSYTAIISASDFAARASDPPSSDPLYEALLRTDAIFGAELNADRVCGRFKLRKGALVAFVASKTETDFLGDTPSLAKGRTVMLIAEASVDKPVRCVYESTRALDASVGSAGCFPSSAFFHMKTRGASAAVPARTLSTGTHLSTGPVVGFSHNSHLPDVLHDYIRISAKTGRSVTLSPNHYVQVHNPTHPSSPALRAASAVRPGDMLVSSDGPYAPHVIAGITPLRLSGQVAPHTPSGTLVVDDGYVVSCYTTAVHPAVAHAGITLLHAVQRWAHPNLYNTAAALLEDNRAADWAARYIPAMLRGPDTY
jgi:Hint module